MLYQPSIQKQKSEKEYNFAGVLGINLLVSSNAWLCACPGSCTSPSSCAMMRALRLAAKEELMFETVMSNQPWTGRINLQELLPVAT